MLSIRYFILLSFLMSFCLLASGQNDTIPAIDEVKPEYPGGEKALIQFISDNLVYPKNAFKKGIQGIVYTQFVLDEEGNVVEPTIIRGIDPELDAEALRLIKLMPKWQPGMQRGRPVKVKFTMPLKFKLDEPSQPVVHSGLDNKDISVGLYFMGGYSAFNGEIHRNIGNMGWLGYGGRVEVKRLSIMTELEFGFGAETKQEFDANGYWRKGRSVSLFSTNILAGYALGSGNGWKFLPYSGIKINALGSFEQEPTDPKDGFQLTAIGIPIGIMATHRYKVKDRGPLRANASLLHLGLEYSHLQFDDNLRGGYFMLKMKLGRDWLSQKRFKEALL